MKSILKYILFTLLLTFTTVLFSQQRGNRGGSSQHQGQNNLMPQQAINPQNMAEIIMYNYDEVVKKLKIKKTPKKGIVKHAILKYNNKINEIKTFNYETFDDVKSFLTKKRNEVLLNHDFNTMRESQITAREMLAPIRSKVQLQKNTLNTTFKKELTEKQYKTWLKYQRSELKKLKPKTQEKSQGQGNRQSFNRRGQGQGQRRY
ncbi:MAG: hypothetical protein QM495_02090 [Lutibacter sp.]|uniref:hypothetical protein n=1 Tax=Lutibacter sp. TaxID=1925666 RepID=UPI00385D7218